MTYHDRTPRKSQKSDPVGEVGLISHSRKSRAHIGQLTSAQGDSARQAKSRSATSVNPAICWKRSSSASRLARASATVSKRSPRASSSGRNRAMSNFGGTGKPSSTCAVLRADMFCGRRTMGDRRSQFIRASAVARRRCDQLRAAVHFFDENRFVQASATA